MTKSKIQFIFLSVMVVCLAVIADEPVSKDCKACENQCSMVPWPKECFNCCWLSVVQGATKMELKSVVGLNDETSDKLKASKGKLTFEEAKNLLGEKEVQNIQGKFDKMSDIKLLYLTKSPEGKKKFLDDIRIINKSQEKPEVK